MSEYVNAIEVVKNDKLYDLNLKCCNASGTGVDLTGYSEIRLKIFRAGATTSKIDTVANIVVDNVSNGELHYVVQQGDFDKVGAFSVEIQVTWTAGKILTYRGLTIHVVEEAP
jgi:hypothetical protein